MWETPPRHEHTEKINGETVYWTSESLSNSAEQRTL